ncbi:transcriptional regulation of mitochondrial recombination-domain-containing protein [Achaetomium macrosporum]|uniref:Large ribosomal subunit protein mL67 n=1 Tax=Achaetomium macrosporum TaxID=79813 RepID=A0AAN7C146_9PEZI|nr:transcriptional regulation of mitochondrial recombination-domain-containing protein [Achaetomium macrosporum]
MNTLRRLPLLSRLGFGTRTIPGMRHASTEATVAATTPAATPVPVPAVDGAQKQGKERRPRSIPPPGHGERLWVHNHITANLIVYSLTPEMRSTKAFRQFAYTGKKLVPAKLRKDYWRPMAVVEFAAGKGDVGRSVFQKLRELKKRHLLEWEDEALLNMSRRERGKALNDQRGNAVADLAHVLAGRGKGNKVVVTEEDEEQGKKGRGNKKGQKIPLDGVVEVKKDGEAAEKVKLHQATVYWANEQDKYFAQEWTENVNHVVGLPEKGTNKGEEVVEPAASETEAAAEAPKTEAD